ncbi:hypothetical protein M406DRAFT_76193 [Cryphonectria parasitica EP155]|uniref:Uncharacterized protein n=1 Tax=Cryphonectria parasitica (strain ATCC 38755 / EP155) TaxID=660469 RepID=A0A9P4XW60_CRYP1|nr:uncharacterized protein M406DRAFT_76193 [Cryphonectria parasitica EP155]KAF3762118.1 hypothetical protein M406DRAFT_76193 [Cryphonectria parasitica EP155]
MAPDGTSGSLQLFGTDALQVRSNTRAKWASEEAAAFQSFATKHRQEGDGKPWLPSTDITPLLQELGLDRFSALHNVDGDELGPILEVKVRRKLQSVWSDLALSTDAIPEKTRLQAARAQAIRDGEVPPTKLARPKEIYTPETWTTKIRARAGLQKSGSKLTTVEGAQKEVSRLEGALESARLQLAKLRKAEKEEEAGKEAYHPRRARAYSATRQQRRPHMPPSPTEVDSDSVVSSAYGDESNLDQDEEEGDDAIDALAFNHDASRPSEATRLLSTTVPSRAQESRKPRFVSVPILRPAPTPAERARIRRQAGRISMQPGDSAVAGCFPQKTTRSLSQSKKSKGKTSAEQQSSLHRSDEHSDDDEVTCRMDRLKTFLDKKYGRDKHGVHTIQHRV